MKAFTACILTFVLTVLLFRSDLTAWRLVRRSELTALEQKIASLGRRPGDWMRDPNYRTPLEKTRVAGVTLPETPKLKEGENPVFGQ